MQTVNIGGHEVSRLILGSNPFSGFSHQGTDRDREMVEYYTVERIIEEMRRAEKVGINTIIARGDKKIRQVMKDYWQAGGTLQWFCQTCPEMGDPAEKNIDEAAEAGARAVHVHGGYMDAHVDREDYDPLYEAIERIRSYGLSAGVAGHKVSTLQWAVDHLDVDYFMCSYYNPIRRSGSGEHQHGSQEVYMPEHREAMTGLIATLPKPAIHYKVMAAGRHDPEEAFAYVAQHLRDGDACCVGVYSGDNENMVAENAETLQAALESETAV
jgi:hypothetical protein